MDIVVFKMCLFVTSNKLTKLKWQLHQHRKRLNELQIYYTVQSAFFFE